MNLNEMWERAKKALADADAIQKKSLDEKRSMTKEEEASFDAAIKEVDQWEARYDRAKNLEERERKLGEKPEEREEREKDEQEEKRKKREERRKEEGKPPEFRSKRPEERVGDDEELSEERRKLATPEYRSACMKTLMNRSRVLERTIELTTEERAALQAGLVGGGNELRLPARVSDDLLKDLEDEFYMFRFGMTDFGDTLEEVRQPAFDEGWSRATFKPEMADADDVGGGTTTKILDPNRMTGYIRISEKLSLGGISGFEARVRAKLLEQFMIGLEEDGMSGSGAGEPLGGFTPSAEGIPLSRDLETPAGVTAIENVGYDEIIDVIESLPLRFERQARLICHRDVWKQLRKLKDNDGRPLLTDRQNPGDLPKILNFDLIKSPFAPLPAAPGDYWCLFGDLSKYKWVGLRDFRIWVPQGETQARQGYIPYYGVWYIDGGASNPKAFTRGKLAAI